jgi:diguanylate cyclase (GGDEF)-like protein
MHADPATFMIAGGITTALSGLLLLGVWTQVRRETALLWWAAANSAYAVGIAHLLVGFSHPSALTLSLGLIFTNLCPALIWAGVRRFGGRRVHLTLLVSLAVPWTVATLVPLAGGPDAASAAVSFAGWLAFLFAAIWEFWRGRGERLWPRWALMALLAIHAGVYAGGLCDFLTGNFMDSGMPAINSWFGAIYVEGLFYSMGSAIFMALLCKERSELGYIKAASIDALTGTANRAAFFDNAERVFLRCRQAGSPLSVIMFDLDRFKFVNDTCGHRTGDDVLRLFADTVRSALRPNDLFGRYGGEEFVVVLPNATVDLAYVVAERIRHAFADACRDVDGLPPSVTVSAGVATASAEAGFEAVLNAADAAMYRAKRLGRNRVERASDAAGRDGNAAQTTVVRAA